MKTMFKAEWFERLFELKGLRWASLFVFALLVGGVAQMRIAAAPPTQASAGVRPRVVRLLIRGEVEPLLAEYLDRGLDEAAASHASLVLISMDTPGGLSDSMEQIIQHILRSPVPVAIYVEPAGSRGASAGFFILLSADVAAMAPGTHTGAASPLLEIGGFPLNVDDTLKKKILGDATAFLRSYTGERGRNVALAETAVTEGKAFTEKEALDGKLIDLLANSEDDLLRRLDGRTIKRFDGTSVTLHLVGAETETVEETAREKFLSRIVQPDIFFILLIAGVLGLYAEFTHPGMIAPGVIGGICLLLALYAMHILPVNLAGLLLVVLALALFILEAKFTSHGVLGAGGVVAMLLGALMLIRSPLTSGGVSLGAALGVTLPFAVLVIMLMRLVLKSRSWKQTTGREQLLGLEGEATQAIAPGEGAKEMVRIHGELWRAASSHAIAAGERVRVVRVDGLTLHVVPAEKTSRPAA
jgi:membrane-bound serine protease (ClpP class)